MNLNTLMSLKFRYFLSICISFFPVVLFGQMRENNGKDTFLYFKEYDYYLNSKHIDTTKLFLKADSKMVDVQKISEVPYSGVFEFGVFRIDRKNNTVTIELFNEAKVKLKTEVYHYDTNIKTTTTQYFFSLTGQTKILKWKTLETYIRKP